jgi:hypothetical protein
MRSHATIVREAGAKRLFEFLVGRGFPIPSASTIHNWASRDAISSEYWNALEEGGFATLKELASYAESRKVARPEASAGDGAQAALA